MCPWHLSCCAYDLLIMSHWDCVKLTVLLVLQLTGQDPDRFADPDDEDESPPNAAHQSI